MKKFIFLPILFFLLSCATGTWNHRSGNNSDLNYHSGYCRSFANSKAPIYICRNPFMCASDEISIVLMDWAENESTYKNCMYTKGYNYR